jgi:hypothetical protein
MLFHFANAPLLPLVGQKLAFQHPTLATAMMSSCIIAAQMIMLPIALLVPKDLTPQSPDDALRLGRLSYKYSAYCMLLIEAAMANPAGKSSGEFFRLDFNRRLMVQFRGRTRPLRHT